MILDYEQELTTAAGQLFVAGTTALYGTKPYDQKAAGGDPAIGEPLDAFLKVDSTGCNNLTDYTCQIVASTTGAYGGSEDSLCSRVVVLASLGANAMVRIGRIYPGQSTKRYLAAKLTVNGSDPSTGKIKVWLQKASDGTPSNKVLL